MLKESFIIAISLPIYLIFLLIHLKKKVAFSKIIINSLFYFYIVAVISVTLFPFPIQASVIESGQANQYLQNNFIPFNSILQILSTNKSWVILRQIGGNILLAVPLGFLMSMLWKNKNNLFDAIKIGFLFSLGIEATQFLISAILGYTYKLTDIDDIILNTLGCILGYFLFILVSKIFQKRQAI